MPDNDKILENINRLRKTVEKAVKENKESGSKGMWMINNRLYSVEDIPTDVLLRIPTEMRMEGSAKEIEDVPIFIIQEINFRGYVIGKDFKITKFDDYIEEK